MLQNSRVSTRDDFFFSIAIVLHEYQFNISDLSETGKTRSPPFFFSIHLQNRTEFSIDASDPRGTQGCQMLCSETKNPNLGKFLKGFRLEIGIFY
jgi:hypothetical protein